MLLSILIPTYNRKQELKKNLAKILNYIKNNKLKDIVEIIISDNNSPDQTADFVNNFINDNKEITIKLKRQKKNIGLEKNSINILTLSNAEYVMFLGDDDFINEKYLLEVLKLIKNDKGISCIIPSYQNILPSGKKLNRGRDLHKKSKRYKKGFINCLINSWRGHQLSGLVLKRENLFYEYEKNLVNNIYLFIFFVAISSLKGDTFHLTDYPVLVTRPGQSKKDWGYGDDGLIFEVFDNYKKLPGITLPQRALLELRFLDVHYWRYAMYLKLGIRNFLNAILKIIKGKNTSFITKIIFPVAIPFIFIKHLIVLIFNGNLMTTLKTKVEV
jgi:glycosyltransferase involved in cell wall biosynthesis